MDSNSIYKKVEHHAVDLFNKNTDETLVFHNLRHTKTVVSRTKEIAGHYDISERDTLVLYTAAWFHDTGHLFSKPVGHEVKSADIMRSFMEDNAEDKSVIGDIEQCIMATKAPRNPATLLHEIICDADTYHLGTKEFKETNKLVFRELELKNNGRLNRYQANKDAVALMEEHRFYTSYCKERLEEQKQKNIKKLKKKLSEMPNPESRKSLIIDEKNNLATKGIQTMLRLTSENQMKLSDMADHKANILISVNAIIISVILTVLLRRLTTEAYLTIPTIIFLVVAVVTIVIAILATRPKIISDGTFTDQDIEDKKTNLLFFGNFHKSTLEQYDTAMRKMMRDSDYLYSSVIKDIFMLGVVLGRKYRLIRLAYNIFMIGIIVSVVAFAIAAIFYASSTPGAIQTGTGSPL
ncbi:MAG: HD domain-containing protein [Segetibacter sp.]|nr:HD domain-containing protein [Segetibacter sp.]